jgi:hypothetical protein
VNGVGNVDAAVVVQQHPKDCPLCGGKREVNAAPMRWRAESLRPAWPLSRREVCPWPFGADRLLESLGVDLRASADPDGVA